MKKCNKRICGVITSALAVIGLISLVVLFFGIYKFNFTNNDIHEVENLENESAVHSQYAGQEERGIKALSKNDVEGLLSGAGTPFGGMAKPAELNGYPGPRHVLDAFEAGELELIGTQKDQIEELYAEMRSSAIELGIQIIDIEKEIDDAFTNKTITNIFLQEKVKESANSYAQLRVIHLKYHLQMVDILSEEQVIKYNHLRGYTKEGGPCENIPEGHDAELWKLHNDCQ